MTVRFGRACFAAFATVASLMPLVSAQATEQAAPQAGVEGAQKPAAEQPADGVAVTYPLAYAGGDLDGCTAEVAEKLYPRDEGPGASTRSRPT